MWQRVPRVLVLMVQEKVWRNAQSYFAGITTCVNGEKCVAALEEGVAERDKLLHGDRPA